MLFDTLQTDREARDELEFHKDYTLIVLNCSVYNLLMTPKMKLNKLSMYNMYIQTPLDPEFETFKEAISVKQYKESECLFRTVTDW